jgi:predicted DNA-binding transcriptional regulator AlpA
MLAKNGPTQPKFLLTSRETAQALGISPRTSWMLTAPRGSLPTVRIGQRVLYRPQDVNEFIHNQIVKPVEANRLRKRCQPNLSWGSLEHGKLTEFTSWTEQPENNAS